jgi:hypothetical protein
MSAHDHDHAPTRDELTALIQRRAIPAHYKTVALALGVLGLGAVLVAALMGDARAWQAWHVNWLYFTTISSAAVMFAAVQRITTARWSRAVIRIQEGFVAWLPIAFVLLLLTIFLGREAIYPWVTSPPTLHEKQVWLATPFFLARSIVVFGILTALSVWYVRTSVRLDVAVLPEWGAAWAKGIREGMRRGFGDERRELHSTHSLQGRLAVILALVFGYGWTVLAWDHSMSLNWHFQSTMYGWQVFMGGWVVSLMIFSILLRVWRNFMGAHDVITETHFWDVGKLCFAFTAFWGYLTFSQFLVIWYGNWPEETHFFTLRLTQPWTNLTVTVAVLMFLVPFFGLLAKSAKTYTPTMTLFALCSIVGLWIHRYIEIYPSIHLSPEALPFGLWEVVALVGYAGMWSWSYMQFMDAFPRMRVFLMTSPHRDEVQVPYDPKTMEPLPAHE